MKKFCSLIICLCMILITVSIGFADERALVCYESESNNTYFTADQIYNDDSVYGTISSATESCLDSISLEDCYMSDEDIQSYNIAYASGTLRTDMSYGDEFVVCDPAGVSSSQQQILLGDSYTGNNFDFSDAAEMFVLN